MSHKRKSGSQREHKTYRIQPEIQAKIASYAGTTGWSEAKIVNALLKAAQDAIAGNLRAPQMVKEIFDSAEELELAKQKSERLLAPLRKKAAEARKALRPVVQKIKAVKKGMLKQAA
jgi:hypothetical protein